MDDGSRIERLEMRQFYRPTCEQAFRGVISSSRLLYLFDHDVETARLDEIPRAAYLQQTLVELLR